MPWPGPAPCQRGARVGAGAAGGTVTTAPGSSLPSAGGPSVAGSVGSPSGSVSRAGPFAGGTGTCVAEGGASTTLEEFTMSYPWLPMWLLLAPLVLAIVDRLATRSDNARRTPAVPAR